MSWNEEFSTYLIYLNYFPGFCIPFSTKADSGEEEGSEPAAAAPSAAEDLFPAVEAAVELPVRRRAGERPPEGAADKTPT